MKEYKNIEVRTVNNGYILEFDGMKQNGYMFHSIENLVRGVMVHLGVEETEYMNLETVDNFIQAVTNWNEVGKNVKEIMRLTDQCRRLESLSNSSKKETLRMRTKMALVLDYVKSAIKENDEKERKKTLQNTVRVIGAVRELTKKEQELLNTLDENDDEENDE